MGFDVRIRKCIQMDFGGEIPIGVGLRLGELVPEAGDDAIAGDVDDVFYFCDAGR